MYGNITENKWLEDEENKIPVSDVLSKLKEYDAVFPVLHGKYGEDGAIAGLLELARVNYVGCKMLGSSIAMDKILSKELVNAKTINIVPYIALSNKECKTDLFDKLELKNNNTLSEKDKEIQQLKNDLKQKESEHKLESKISISANCKTK